MLLARMNTGRLELESSIAPKAHRRESLHKLPIRIFKEQPATTKVAGELPSITRFWTPSTAGKSRKTRFRWEGAQYSLGLEPVNRLSRSLLWDLGAYRESVHIRPAAGGSGIHEFFFYLRRHPTALRRSINCAHQCFRMRRGCVDPTRSGR